jgi:transcription elongation factor Elf1
MECCCTNETYTLKIKADVDIDPLWCGVCGCNIDIEEAPLSDELKEELMIRTAQYGNWIDWEADHLRSNGIEREEQHNEQGRVLARKIRKELVETYTVTFYPAAMGRKYANDL